MIGKRIKLLRTRKGLTQRELANYLSLTPKMISFYENGQRFPPHDIIVKLSEKFKVTTDYLLGTTDNEGEDYPEDLPDDFETAEEAIDFLLNKNVIMGFGGFDVEKLSDEEKVQFAHELLEHLKLLSYKYKR